MLLQCKKREVRLVAQVCPTSEIGTSPIRHGAPSGSSISGDTVDISSRSNGELCVSFCRGSTPPRLVVGDRVCSQPMLPQIAGRFSQCSDSLLNTQSEHQLPAPALLLVILPRLILLIQLVSHVMCQTTMCVELFLSIWWNPDLLNFSRTGRTADCWSKEGSEIPVEFSCMPG